MKKRIATLFLAIIMLLTLAVPAFAESFSDVGSSMGTKYRDAINYMSDNGIMVGFEDGTFQPNTVLNRGMAVTILFRMSTDTNNTYSHNFTDVPSGSPYNNAIGWAKAKGICYGTTDTTFEPYAEVTKQQFITFLYRFAGYCGYSQDTGDVSIDSFADYSSLVAYARDSFKWAYNFALFDGGDFSSSYLQPLSTVSRKNASLLCLNYRHNVEGIVHGRDAFNFVNTANSFVSGTNSMYLMSEADWSSFESLAEKHELCDSNTINSMRRKEWTGACFGMSVAVALDYSGKIDFNGNFCNNVSNMFDVPNPSVISNSKHKLTTAVQNNETISVAESKINLLHYSQYLEPISSWKSKISPNLGLRELVEGQSNGGIGIFSFSYYDTDGALWGHAIVVYGKPEQVNATTTRVYIYDVNDDVNQRTRGYIEITKCLDVWEGKVVTSVEKQIESCKYLNDLSTFSNYLDLDGADNTITTLTATSTDILNNYTVLSVQAEGETTITNSRGKTIVIDNSGIGGTMNTYKENLIVFGEDAPPLYLFAVPKSDSFTCVAETGELLSFHATDNTGTVGFSAEEQTGSELTSVTVSNMASCVVNGEAIK